MQETNYPRAATNLFTTDQMVLKRQIMKLAGGAYKIFDSAGNQLVQANQKGFKLKEDIRLLTGPSLDQETVGIFARKVMDFASAYDVVDLTTNTKVGALRRRGFKSMLRDEWIVMDANDHEIGKLIEDSMAMAVLRRLLAEVIGNWIPQNYDLLIGDRRVVDLKQNFNPFNYQLRISFEVPHETFDRRIGLAAAVLLAAIEGKQG
ncbi:hypothetical protein EON82_20705 [bacterium]|nr:MAG: hypothetical protein EON82_20705 [bacterium]